MNFVINADDFGMDEDTSKAIIQAFEENRINRTTAMVNMDNFEESYKESIRKDFFSAVGLHLNLTKGVPLTDKIRECDLFCNQDGTFNGRCMQSSTNRLLPLSTNIKNAVYEEIDAQFKKYMDYYGQKGACHVDSHHHVHKNLNILPLCLEIAKKYGFTSIRFAKTSGSLINCYYNRIVNYSIKKRVKLYYELFDSVSDYKVRCDKHKPLCFFEVECHPKVNGGILYDGEEQLPLLEYYSRDSAKDSIEDNRDKKMG